MSDLLKNLARLPPSLHTLASRHAGLLRDALADNLVGVYVHGSVATGGFIFENSDFDYLVVINRPLSEPQYHQLTTFYQYDQATSSDLPANGVELSIVLARYVGKGFVYPTPYELHAYTEEGKCLPQTFGTKGLVDPDLATHFMITRQHGFSLCGPAVDNLFAEVPAAAFADSIKRDCEQSYRNIMAKTPNGNCRVPRYAVLNYCRTLAYLREGAFLAKVAGGAWGLKNLPERFQPLISAALAEQAEPATSELIPGKLLIELAEWGRERLVDLGK